MKNSNWINVVIAVLFFMVAQAPAKAQRMAVTSNLLEDAMLAPNLGVDIVVADRQSFSLDLTCAPYKLSENVHNKQMAFRTAYKFWFNQALYAHFLSIDGVVCSSEVRLGKIGSRDEYVGLGVGYGYSFIINKNINIVPSVGIGLAYGSNYEGTDHMIKPNEGVQAIATAGIRPILTRLSVTIQYVLK